MVRSKSQNRRSKKQESTKGSTLKAIASYIFFWPSIRKYALYIYMFFKGKKDKKKYDYWKD